MAKSKGTHHRRKPAVDRAVIHSNSKCLHELYAHADINHIRNTIRMLRLPFDVNQIQEVQCQVCQNHGKTPLHPTFDYSVTKPMQEVLVDVAEIEGVSMSDSKSGFPVKCVFFYDMASGFYYMQQIESGYDILLVIHNFVKLAQNQEDYELTFVKTPEVAEELTFTRRKVQHWIETNRMTWFPEIRKNARYGYLDDHQFDHLCWIEAAQRAVKVRTGIEAGSRLHRIIVDTSEKLLQTLGLPHRYALFAAKHYVFTHNLMADNRPGFNSDMLPSTLFSGKTNEVERISPFGCFMRFLDASGPTRLGLLLGYGSGRSLIVVDYYTQEIITICGDGRFVVH